MIDPYESALEGSIFTAGDSVLLLNCKLVYSLSQINLFTVILYTDRLA